MTEQEQRAWQNLALRAGTVFTPNTPIDARSLFAGREQQVRRIVDVVNQTGQHAMLFGERGTGKTSLANVLSEFLPGWGAPGVAILAPRVNCDGGDDFGRVWKKVFDQIELTSSTTAAGFSGEKVVSSFSPLDLLQEGDEVSPDFVRRALTLLVNRSPNAMPILIIDEFDRLEQGPRRAFADLIKSLSDHAVSATVVLVGVADSVGELIQEHQSVSRALVQVQMPRMNETEVREIITKGLGVLGMTITPSALDRIVLLSQGLPHYTHLVGLHASRMSIDRRSMEIGQPDVKGAIEQAIQDAQHSVQTEYHVAIRSSRKENLFADVLLACALADKDQLGFFAANDVRGPIQVITGRPYDIPSFARHLTEFSDDKRGRVLQKTGESRRHRYRFNDPLMQPFVVMQGMADGRLPEDLPQNTPPDNKNEPSDLFANTPPA